MQELIGKTVLKFETDGGAVAYYVDGESWFSEITEDWTA